MYWYSSFHHLLLTFYYFFLALNRSGTSIFEQLPVQPGQFMPQDLIPFLRSCMIFLISNTMMTARIRLTTIVPIFAVSHSMLSPPVHSRHCEPRACASIYEYAKIQFYHDSILTYSPNKRQLTSNLECCCIEPGRLFIRSKEHIQCAGKDNQCGNKTDGMHISCQRAANLVNDE